MVYGLTHKGLKRDTNQDRYLAKAFDNGAFLLAVADGLGGEAGGDLAASIAVEHLNSYIPKANPPERDLLDLVKSANGSILDSASENPALEGMGTTLTMAYWENGKSCWVHVGDSRLYLYREGSLTQITEDHTGPGLLVADGEMSKEAARVHPMRSLLFQCLGREEFVADKGCFDTTAKDLLLLSTDGLHGEVPESAILAILKSDVELRRKVQALVDAALETGGKDNITVVIAELNGR